MAANSTRRNPAACGILVAALALASASPALAQAPPSQPDLDFPKQAGALTMFSSLAMGIWKPEGDGPFPALLIVHGCGGMKQHIGYWRKEAIRRGYVAFVIDAFSSRGSAYCRPTPPIPMARGVEDILDAAAHLKRFDFVDPARIAMIGFSWGAMAGLLAGSPGYVSQAAREGEPLAAAVALYPACYTAPYGTFPGRESLRPDIATPTLLLLGGQDTETPPDECLQRLPALQAREAAVEMHVFEGATHCWDCRDLDGQRRTPPWAGGRVVGYTYDDKVTEESAERAFEFLGRRLRLAATQ